MTTLVLLDFGGTIDADGDRWSVRFHRAYQVLGGRRPLEDYEPSFRKSDLLLAELPGIRTMGWRDTVTAQARLLGPLLRESDGPAPAAVAAAFLAEAEVAIERNRRVLEEVRASHRLGIISNFTGNLETCLIELGLHDLFEVVADSARVGASKPDPEIFRWALRRTAPADQVWMVGDNFDADIRPAAALGWSTCWLAPADRAAPAEGLATARIGGLDQLPGVLAGCTV